MGYNATMSLSAREELVRLQRRLYQRNKALIAGSVQVHEPKFAAYERRYQRAVSQFERAVSHETMLSAIAKSDLIYVGDYHTCAQSQRSFLRILKAVVKTTRRPLTIGLELLHARQQPLIDAYLAGKLSDQAFVEKVGLRKHWVFDLWENFRPIFDFAHYHKIPILGIDAAGRQANLAARDAATGALLAKYSAQYPQQQILALIGDLHLAPQHLPRETTRALAQHGVTRRDLILYQNSDTIYWRLAQTGREHRVDVLKLNARSFCRMHTPPIVCQQSYLNWLEHEEGEFDFSDAKHQFVSLVEQVAAYLQIPLPKDTDDVMVYTCGDLSFLHILKKKRSFSVHELKLIREHVLASESYIIPKDRMVYLANLSLNHAAEEASHYLKFLCSGPEFSRPLVDAFYANVLHEALGFFGSKLVNQKRKCWHEGEFRALQKYFRRHGVPAGRELEATTAQLVLGYLGYEVRRKPLSFKKIFQQPPVLFFAVTHALGYMLGDRMFYGVMGHKLRRSYVRKLFTESWWFDGQTFDAYQDLQQRLASVTIPERMT